MRESIPKFLNGIFSFVGAGYEKPSLLSGKLTYLVPPDKRTQLIYFRGGNSSDEMVYFVMMRDDVPMRYFAIGARAGTHVPLAVPARLLPRPESIETLALLPDHPPVSFTWRGIRHRVKRADGPERVFGEWWKRDVELIAVRDYFRVEDKAGERFWIYRAGDGEDATTGSQQWFLHGIFG